VGESSPGVSEEPPKKKKKRKKKPLDPASAAKSAREAEAAVRAEERARIARGVLALVALAYLVTLWLDGVGSNLPSKLLPRPWIYFAQVAALFPKASPVVIDYRAEGWSCEARTWNEIDVRPYFPLDRDNKENRFQRALQFYRQNRTVMQGLETFVLQRYNAEGVHGAGPGQIAGVRFSSLRIPFPAPGEHVEPYERKPLASYPAEQRHAWYWTKKSRRAERCGYSYTPPTATDDEGEPEKAAPAPKEPEWKEPE
jgi:hypothetical protein